MSFIVHVYDLSFAAFPSVAIPWLAGEGSDELATQLTGTHVPALE